MKAVMMPCCGTTALGIVKMPLGMKDPSLPKAPTVFGNQGSQISISLFAAASLGVGLVSRSHKSRCFQPSSRRFLVSQRGYACCRIVQRAATNENTVSSSDASEAVKDAPQLQVVDQKIGVVLMNIGTPDSYEVDDVRDYLARFLGDDRVLEIPQPFKFVLLQLLLGTRPQKSAENYKSIWDESRGSPLKFHTEDLVAGLHHMLGDEYAVRMCFQYSAPFTADVISEFGKMDVSEIVLLPMFPQYASGTTGTCLSVAYETAAKLFCTPYLTVVPPFFNSVPWISAQSAVIADVIGPKGENVDHTLFSFHGLPVEQCLKSHVGEAKQLSKQLTENNRNCYYAQCHESARKLALELGLENHQWSVAFQSRLTLRGTIKWVEPYTDEVFASLAKEGVRRLAVTAPSFTIDCVETLEELDITGREQFEEAGGEELIVIPCVNSSRQWVSGLADLVHAHTRMGGTRKIVNFRDVCPISGKQGVWRSQRHPQDELEDVPSVAAEATDGIGG